MIINCKAYREIVDSANDGVSIIGSDFKITYWNHAAEEIAGHKTAEMVAKSCREDCSMYVDENGKDLCDTVCPIVNPMDGKVREVGKAYIRHAEGFLKPISVRIVPIEDDDGEIIGAAEIMRDLSSQAVIEQILGQLERLVMYDPVTEMPNRQYVELSLRGRLAEVKRYGWFFGVLFIRVDNFAGIKEKHGNDAAERVLRVAAMTMRNTLRPFDILGRWRDEYFIVIISNVTDEQLAIVAERLRVLVANSTLMVGENTIKIAVSGGGTIARENDSIELILRRTGKMMIRARERGGNVMLMTPKPEYGEKYNMP